MTSNRIRRRTVFFACVVGFLLTQLPTSKCIDRQSLPLSTPSKMLIWPADYSHWLSMKIIAENLVKRGTEITVLRPSCYKDFIKESEEFTFINFDVPDVKLGDQLDIIETFLRVQKLGERKPTFLESLKAQSFYYHQIDQRYLQCKALLENRNIFNQLKKEKYDLVFADPMVACGEIIAAKLGIPLVFTVRIIPGEVHYQCSQTPVLPSYVPMLNSELTDKMTFLQRTRNTLTYLFETSIIEFYFRWFMDPLVKEYVGPEFNYKQLAVQTSLWLIRTDFAFEYPRPLMPHVKFIGGLHCRPPKPLTNELEKFVNGSGEDGFITFTMGSMVRGMHKSKSNIIAGVLAKLKQRVVWRYVGERPDMLGSNTKIMPWIPQNDLLGHSKCRLFITHGGTNGIYEAIYHGVPILGIPLFFDQSSNMVKIKSRGAGEMIDISDLNGTEFQLTIESMIKNKRYKENVMHLSTLHRDTIMTPLDSAIYWIEYVIRHKGAYHLRPAAQELWWFQYLLLDVIVFFVSVMFSFVLSIKKLRKLLSKTTGKIQEKSKQE